MLIEVHERLGRGSGVLGQNEAPTATAERTIAVETSAIITVRPAAPDGSLIAFGDTRESVLVTESVSAILGKAGVK